MPPAALRRGALILAFGSLAACVPPSNSKVDQARKKSARSAIPPGVPEWKAEAQAERAAAAKAARERPAEVEAPFDPARAPVVRARYQDPARTVLDIEILQPRFFNLEPSLFVHRAGTFAPHQLARAMARFLQSNMQVCGDSGCGVLRSVVSRGVVYPDSGRAADSIGNEAFVLSRLVQHTRPKDGRCVVSRAANRTGRVLYLSPRLIFRFEAVVEDGPKDATVEVFFPGLTDAFAGAPAGVSVVGPDGGEVVCRAAWSGQGQPEELVAALKVPLAGPSAAETPSVAPTETSSVAPTETSSAAQPLEPQLEPTQTASTARGETVPPVPTSSTSGTSATTETSTSPN